MASELASPCVAPCHDGVSGGGDSGAAELHGIETEFITKARRYFRVPHPAATWAYQRMIARHGQERVGEWNWNLSPYDFTRKMITEAWGMPGHELTRQLAAKAAFWRLASLDQDVVQEAQPQGLDERGDVGTIAEAKEVVPSESTQDLDDSTVVEDCSSIEFEFEEMSQCSLADSTASEASLVEEPVSTTDDATDAAYVKNLEDAEATRAPQLRWCHADVDVWQPAQATCPPRTGRTGYFMRARGRGAPSAVD